MNDSHQMAAELYDSLTKYARMSLAWKCKRADVISIIQTVIEKAIKQPCKPTDEEIYDYLYRSERGNPLTEAVERQALIESVRRKIAAHASDDFKRVQELATQMVAVREALGLPKSTFEEVIARIKELVPCVIP